MLMEVFKFAGIHTWKLTKTSKYIRNVLLEILDIYEAIGTQLPISPSPFTRLIVGTDPLHLLSTWGKTTSTIDKELLLFDAIRTGDIRSMETLIRRGVDLNYKNQMFAAKCAVSFNRPECLLLIFKYNPPNPFPPVEGPVLLEDMFTHTADVKFQVPVDPSIPPIILSEYVKRGKLEIFTRRRWMNDGRIFAWFRRAAFLVDWATPLKGIMMCDNCFEQTGSPAFCKGWVYCPLCTDTKPAPIKLSPRVTIYNDDGVYTPVNENIIDSDSDSDSD